MATTRKSRKGKAAVITDPIYKENLPAQKVKNIKKELIDKQKKKKVSDVTNKKKRSKIQ